MTISLEIGSWMIPTAITAIAFGRALWLAQKMPSTGGYGDVGNAAIVLVYVMMALITALVAWLVWAIWP
jgi:hypothetical protein